MISEDKYTYKCDKISIQNFFQLFRIKVSCNMKFYEDNLNELEKDLDRNVNATEIKDNTKLEQEIFKKLMFKWFGIESNSVSDQSKDFMLQDFHCCFTTNFYFATAEINNFYLIINFCL